jgi:3,4-dihydroxy 2-butanone 4-phosphate synthase/GTP cyclohydrolase II
MFMSAGRKSPFNDIADALEDIRQGRMVIVVDDEDRENEGDFIMAAEKVTAQSVNFMAKHARGLICMPMIARRLDELGLSLMVDKNTAKLGTPFTISVDAVHGTSTGISAHDRAVTVRALIDPKTSPEDLARPGHIFPLRAMDGGVLRRAGHTEAAVDLATLAGQYPAGLLCEIMAEDGTMARLPALVELKTAFKLKLITIKDLIEYRRRTEKLIRRLATTKLPSKYGQFTMHLYEDILSGDHHVALVKGPVRGAKDVLVRVHSQCLTGDLFGSLRCDCGEQMEGALRRIEREGKGVFLYMRQEGRGIGLANKLRAYELQDQGRDTVEANEELGFPPDLRDYGIGAQILVDMGLSTIRIMTNNPCKITGLDGYGLTVVERIPLQVEPREENVRYLEIKRQKLGHLLKLSSKGFKEPKRGQG